jgi:hypothetical protein
MSDLPRPNELSKAGDVNAGSIPVARLLSPVQLYLYGRLPYVCGATLRFCGLRGLIPRGRVVFQVSDRTR